jgi:hypothetical protein
VLIGNRVCGAESAPGGALPQACDRARNEEQENEEQENEEQEKTICETLQLAGSD